MRIITVLIIFILISCKTDQKEPVTNTQTDEPIINVNGIDKDKPVAPRAEDRINANASLPNICNYISEAYVANLTGIDQAAISTKVLNKSASGKVRTCFFKWDDPKVNNAGMIVQVSLNPVTDEVPNFHQMMIQGLMNNGEVSATTGQAVKFQPLKGIGDQGAYSYEIGKYVWRHGHDYGYTVAFNSSINKAKQMSIVKDIAAKIKVEQGY